MWIANQFDTKAEAFKIQGSYLSLTNRDAEHLLDLPSQGEEILKPPQTKNRDLFDEFKTTSKQGAHIKLSSLQEYFQTNKGIHDDNFIRRFVLFVIGVFLCPTTQRYVSSAYLNLVEDVNAISAINWTSLTLNHLMKSIKNISTTKGVYLEGNLPLLQLWYWEKLRADNLDPTIDYTMRDKPLIQYWDKHKAKKRYKIDTTYDYGKGKLASAFHYIMHVVVCHPEITRKGTASNGHTDD
uniref:Aminotransferase-like plant mobile domain-containing protein n=1 Tax=Oryza rufipogon TaxID=4529 RepID=A0A0E0P6Y7_ORYRU